MKIALIHPRIFYDCERPELAQYTNHWYRDIFTRAFNLNLLRIAALTPDQHEVVLIDENRKAIPFDESFDLVGVTAMTYQAQRAYEIAGEFKKRGVPTIFGGIHASVLPQESRCHFDAVCVGEVENVWADILVDVSKGQLRRLYQGADAKLFEVPAPKFEKVKSFLHQHESPGFCFFPMMTTRGCPRGCDYCSATYLFNKSYRKKSIEQVLEEVRQIKQVARSLNIHQFHIEMGDDNFIIDVKRTKQLLKSLCDENITYTASLDIAAADDKELLELLGASGCKIVSVGIESLDVEVLGELGKWKQSQRKKTEKNIESFFRYGITPSCNFMVGSDHTDLKVFKGIRSFVDQFPILFNLLMFTPFPGTPYVKQLSQEGRLRKDMTWRHYNLFNLVHEPKKISRDAFYEEFIQIRLDYDHLSQYQRSMDYTSATALRGSKSPAAVPLILQ